MELFDSGALTISSPLIQIHAKLDEITHGLLEGMLVVNLYQERQFDFSDWDRSRFPRQQSRGGCLRRMDGLETSRGRS